MPNLTLVLLGNSQYLFIGLFIYFFPFFCLTTNKASSFVPMTRQVVANNLILAFLRLRLTQKALQLPL